MRPLLVDLTEDVEQERLHVKIQRLVVQEQLGEQTQVLAWGQTGRGQGSVHSRGKHRTGTDVSTERGTGNSTGQK